ncbi:hypothetical protein KUCAC02_010209 [Chaenocephalus aceratus]|uniref:Uncharacterized protein n=1 Tax=Chaenocephalus aceratus TaxID=36190 RepID=A0ACB9VZZ7_CHAAC|nr:hypothetical protein KUCAC02_010209 [Chaenocephalus aceratus]
MKKKTPNGTLISQMMDQTFPLRRREIVKKEPAVENMVERWPALFTERQVFAECNRVTSRNLEADFFEALDQHTPRFIQLFKSKKGSAFQLFLATTPGIFSKTCFDTTRGEALSSVTVGVLTVLSEDNPQEGPSSMQLEPISTDIVLEGGIVMENIKNFPQAVCLLFGLIYALHLDYPKCMANTLMFLQRVMLGLGTKTLSLKLLTLRNALLD